MHNNSDRFHSVLYDWYDEHARSLPWRETKDAYKIWLSEIILQQTQIVQGTSYYHAFVDAYPTVQELSSAPLEEVYKLWQGLGYYSRARNLHFAAQQIVKDFGGEFPDNYADILKLKGVGKYTAAAIASIAFDEQRAAVDGNVYRFLSRYFLVDLPIDTTEGVKYFAELAQQLMPNSLPGRHNQAMMEFGALQCTPYPQCENCPLADACAAREKNSVGQLPVKAKKVKVRDRYFAYLFLTDGDKLYLHQRTGNDIWKNLYELPLLEFDEDVNVDAILNSTQYREVLKDVEYELLGVSQQRNHILTHQRLHARCLYLGIKDNLQRCDFKLINIEDVERYAVPRLVEHFLEDTYKYIVSKK